MIRIGEEGERLHPAASRQRRRNEARHIDTARPLAVPEGSERAAHAAARNAKRRAPARAAAAKAHHQAGLAMRAAIARGQDAERAVIAMSFFQAEDGIRDFHVTGVQTCALPIYLRSDAVKVAHHGSRTSSTEGFVNASRPALAVVSVGQDSPYGHPHPEVLERWRASGAQIGRASCRARV